jgi:ATP-dependent Clp protease protease subunit
VRKRLNTIMANHPGQPLEQVEKDTDRDNFLSGDESVEYGLIDKVIYSRNGADDESDDSAD